MTTLHELEERILRLEKQNRELKRARKGLIVEPNLNILGQNTRIDGNLYLGGNAVGVWQDWTPTVTAEGSMTISNLSIDAARYCLIGDAMALEVSIRFDTGGTASYQVNVSYPFTIISSSYRSFYSANNIDGFSPGWVYGPSGTAFGVRRAGGVNWTIGAGLRIMANGIIKYK